MLMQQYKWDQIKVQIISDYDSCSSEVKSNSFMIVFEK